MKPSEKKPEIVYRIIGPDGQACGSYSRACHDEYDFRSVEEARNANCHGMFRDPKYTIAKYRVTYELLSADAEGGPPPGPPPLRFVTLADYVRVLSDLDVAGFRIDEGFDEHCVRVQIRHRVSNLFRPARRAAAEATLREAIDHGSPGYIKVEVTASYVPLWLRRKP